MNPYRYYIVVFRYGYVGGWESPVAFMDETKHIMYPKGYDIKESLYR